MRWLLFRLIPWLVDFCERRYGFSPADKYRCEGAHGAYLFAAEQLDHFAWGHPEIDMKGAASAMREYARWEIE